MVAAPPQATLGLGSDVVGSAAAAFLGEANPGGSVELNLESYRWSHAC